MTDIARPTRGLQNRNPGNLRASTAFTWQGQTGVDDKGFVVFATDIYGIRAAVIDLHTGYSRGETSVFALIKIYAPPNENDPQTYAVFVAGKLGVAPTDTLSFDQPTATQLIEAIITMEQGSQPYDDSTIAAGVQSAFAHFQAV